MRWLYRSSNEVSKYGNDCTSVQQLILWKDKDALRGNFGIGIFYLPPYFGVNLFDLVVGRDDVSEFWQLLIDFAFGMALGDDHDAIRVPESRQTYFFLALSINFIFYYSLSSLNFLLFAFLSSI